MMKNSYDVDVGQQMKQKAWGLPELYLYNVTTMNINRRKAKATSRRISCQKNVTDGWDRTRASRPRRMNGLARNPMIENPENKDEVYAGLAILSRVPEKIFPSSSLQTDEKRQRHDDVSAFFSSS